MRTETRVGAFIVIAISIFLYLSFNIGELRLGSGSYYLYKTYFDDTGGLELKSVVKIAGVNVGWVDSINLMEGGRAEIILRIKSTHRLSRNAYATISQDGLIGSKTIEIDPGDPSTGTLPPGSQLAMPGKAPTTITELLDSVREITDSVQDVISVFKGVFASPRGESLMQGTLNNLSNASDRLSKFSDVIESTIKRNEEKIDALIKNTESSSSSLSTGIPNVEKSIVGAGDQFHVTASKFGETADRATGTFEQAESAIRKVNEGDGTLGRLINDSQLHTDIADTVKGIKGFIGKANHLAIDVDGQSEYAFRTGNSRGTASINLRTRPDFFYNVELTSDEYGKVSRTITTHNRFDANNKSIDSNTAFSSDPSSITDDSRRAAVLVAREEQVHQDLTRPTFGFQIGKTFNNCTIRVGMFQNTFGGAVDFHLPLTIKNFTWDTSIEAFDFTGYNRINDDRPYVRWRNRVSFMNNLYTTFGIEDVFSRQRAAPFYGFGFTFHDDDIKYFLSLLSFGSIG